MNARLFDCLIVFSVCFIPLSLFALFAKSGAGVHWKGTYGTVCVSSDVYYKLQTTNYKLLWYM